ncbi:probable L-type lectin-domain containing receptor kinase S.7 [Rutidosis leptorrhynchoides]|uniref:probable L-type lectin-domain containing receptor kinase S.7 n=1 Tax=Rutidosis leptorrhynchoides TaxID=125765 RepID=UPI003A99D08A
MNSRNQLAFLMTIIITYHHVSPSQDITFHFSSLSLRNLTLLGDSYLRNGVVGLTRETGVPSSSSGTVIYNTPVPFFDRTTNSTASFSTRFSFTVNNVNRLSSSVGDGLSFFLSPKNQLLGSPGGYLGLVNSSQLTKNKFIAIEFDTRLDPHFNDPNDNHVGLDIDSLNSIKTVDCLSVGIDLKSGNLITAWIDYWNDGKTLKVFLSESSYKPLNPILDIEIDLTEFVSDVMYLGFSASTEGSTETHYVENWSFTSFGIRHLNPRITNPHNVTDNTISKNPRIEVPNDPSNHSDHHKRIGLAVGILGPVFFCSVLVVFGYISVKKLKRAKTEMNIQAELLTGPKQFSYKELKAATNGFHSSRIIGHGAFGSVYKAVLAPSGSTMAAVKRSKHSHEGKTEFLAELSIIACLRHKNLVPLQGWCVEKGELLLVYEFMPYGSIDKVLYQETEHWNFLKWSHRYNIAVGLASVLTYLHQECEQQVIHRDIKASNVMLDANFNARLGDFGLARLMDHNKSPVSTLTAGTMGYLAPEYLQYGKATDKTDVFSYGVVVLELCCGRRPIEREVDGHKMINLVDWVWDLHSKGSICDAVDKRLNNEFDLEEVRKLLVVGLSCANPDSERRPSMRRVFQILNNEAAEIKVPKKKPMLSFSSGLPLSIEDIMSSSDEEVEDIGRKVRFE